MSFDGIVVDLSKSKNAADFSKGSFFFAKELERAEGLVRQHVDALELPRSGGGAKLSDDERKYTRSHDSISVFGARGAGKTSFILTLMQKIGNDSDLKNKIFVLDIIDPSLLEDVDVFLATIVSNIVQKIDSNKKGIDKESLSNFHSCLKRVANGFRVLYSTSSSEAHALSYGDPELFAEEILRDATSGIKLAESFHAFVAAAAVCLGVKAFVQPLDDIDTAYSRGWKVLETLRRYLSTQRFLTVISGDLDLYRIIVRAEQWKNLSELAKNEKGLRDGVGGRGDGSYINEVDQLQEQYVQKLLPVNRRIHLESRVPDIHRQARNGKELIKVKFSEKENGLLPLSEIYCTFCRDVFAWPYPDEGKSGDRSVIALNYHFWEAARLLPSNTRTLVRFIEVISEWSQMSDVVSGEKGKGRNISLQGVLGVFSDALYNRGVLAEHLNAYESGEGIEFLMQFVFQHEAQLPGISALSPYYSSYGSEKEGQDWNHTLLLIQACVNRGWRAGFHLPLAYMLNVVATSLLISKEILRGKSREPKLVVNELNSQLLINRNESVLMKSARVVGVRTGKLFNGATAPEIAPGLMLIKSWPRVKKLILKDAIGISKDIKSSKGEVSSEWLKVLAGNPSRIDFFNRLKPSGKVDFFLPNTSTWKKQAPENVKALLEWFTVRLQGTSSIHRYVGVEVGIAAIFETIDKWIEAERKRGGEEDGEKEEDKKDPGVFVERLLNRQALTIAAVEVPSVNVDGGKAGVSEGEEDVLETNVEADAFFSKDVCNAFLLWLRCFSMLNDCFERNGVQFAPPPARIYNAYQKFYGNLEKIGDRDEYTDIAYNYNAGSFLERWVIAFLNAMLFEEATHRGFSEADLSSQRILKGFKSFDGNLKIIKDSSMSVWRVSPYAMMLALCPLFQGVISARRRQEIFDLACTCFSNGIESFSEVFPDCNSAFKEALGELLFISMPYHLDSADGNRFDVWSNCVWRMDKGGFSKQEQGGKESISDLYANQILSALILMPAPKSMNKKGSFSAQDKKILYDLTGVDWTDIVRELGKDQSIVEEA